MKEITKKAAVVSEETDTDKEITKNMRCGTVESFSTVPLELSLPERYNKL